MAEHNELGKLGEEAAARYLVMHGYHIRERDWRLGHRDIDIVAEKQGLLVFVEVKTRRNEDYGFPEAGVTPQKMNSILAAANAYILQEGLDMAVRFDVVAVVGTHACFRVRHLTNAFGPQNRTAMYQKERT